MTVYLILIFGVLFPLVFAVISGYTKLYFLRKNCVDTFLKVYRLLSKRYALLEDIYNSSQEHLGEDLEKLQIAKQATEQAINHAELAYQDPLNTEKLKLLASSEINLLKKLDGFFSISDKYPAMKQSQHIHTLMEELVGIEEKTEMAKSEYNNSVLFYNLMTIEYPYSFFAKLFKFRQTLQLDLGDADERRSVRVYPA